MASSSGPLFFAQIFTAQIFVQPRAAVFLEILSFFPSRSRLSIRTNKSFLCGKKDLRRRNTCGPSSTWYAALAECKPPTPCLVVVRRSRADSCTSAGRNADTSQVPRALKTMEQAAAPQTEAPSKLGRALGAPSAPLGPHPRLRPPWAPLGPWPPSEAWEEHRRSMGAWEDYPASVTHRSPESGQCGLPESLGYECFETPRLA